MYSPNLIVCLLEGRYRSAGLFVSDLRYAIEGRVVKKMQELVKGQENAQQMKEKITQCTKLLLDFIQKDLEPCLVL
ncbi:hypothetical protein EON65_35265 [archaeon]|nr:MAG: hypothetical protein EON65_35265 [archaeon]